MLDRRPWWSKTKLFAPRIHPMFYSKAVLSFLLLFLLPGSIFAAVTITVDGGTLHTGAPNINWQRTSTTDSADFVISCFNVTTGALVQGVGVFLLSNTKLKGQAVFLIGNTGFVRFEARDRISQVLLATIPSTQVF
ncbi:hypothetical protein GALMADRAFT_881299 [Galerina marginata CBS 339.88]|uniref:Uncharacterized protein n=1 Tax=Galerina marginata (strain CBS 339.88) TaxID=685588 RepID=A0A067SSM4_GALM3|nr:hypothetical protein GALMADRAFT_881299 [Galerina marginata CBS 339.88]